MVTHKSAQPSHYDQEAESYDAFNEENSIIINQLLANLFSQHHVRSVLDLSCGTGSQVFALTQKGFDVIGIDISPTMLAIARRKAEKNDANIRLIEGDMRSTKAGNFDAAIINL